MILVFLALRINSFSLKPWPTFVGTKLGHYITWHTQVITENLFGTNVK